MRCLGSQRNSTSFLGDNQEAAECVVDDILWYKGDLSQGVAPACMFQPIVAPCFGQLGTPILDSRE